MKKRILFTIIMILLMGIVSGCGNRHDKNDGKLHIVATIFPEYDWVMNVLGDKAADADVTMLLSSGVDLHSFQPTADDIIKISKCDIFLYVGGESDEWVKATLQKAQNKDMIVINLMDVLGDAAKEEEIKEGMEAEEEEEGEETEYDEHVWLSLNNAKLFVNEIRDALSKADAANSETYSANAASYIEKLNELDGKYRDAVANAGVKTVLFGDRFPFRYLTDDYGLDYYAAFVGCSAESEASFQTIIFLAEQVDKLGLSYVLTLENSNTKIAETVISSTEGKSAQILSMDSMQSITSADVKNGVTYLSVMEKNLGVLTKALQK